jgi:hypothetical protein
MPAAARAAAPHATAGPVEPVARKPDPPARAAAPVDLSGSPVPDAEAASRRQPGGRLAPRER